VSSKAGEVRIKVEYEIEVRDRHGRLIEKREGESRSLLRNFIAALRAMLKGTPDTAASALNSCGAEDKVIDVNGSEKTIYGGYICASDAGKGMGWVMAANAPDDDDSYGIVVGKGTATVAPDNYNLDDKIPHGTDVGQLDYGPHMFEEKTTEGNVSYFKFSRTFTNLSGQSVTVQEIGIIAWNFWWDKLGSRNNVKYLILRDVLDSPVSVPDGATLTVRYKFKVAA